MVGFTEDTAVEHVFEKNGTFMYFRNGNFFRTVKIRECGDIRLIQQIILLCSRESLYVDVKETCYIETHLLRRKVPYIRSET